MLKSVKNRQRDSLTRLSWQDFERLLAEHYRELGYQVEHNGTGSSGARSDGGIDLKLRKGDEYLLVQCKHWNAMQVPHNDVHQLMGIMDNQDATGAILITSGEFTAAALAAAGKKGKVQLVDGVQLRQMLGARLPHGLPSLREASAVTELAARRNSPGNRRTRPRGRGRARQPAEKVVVAAVGVLLFLVAVLFARDRMLMVGNALQPKPVRAVENSPKASSPIQARLEKPDTAPSTSGLNGFVRTNPAVPRSFERASVSDVAAAVGSQGQAGRPVGAVTPSVVAGHSTSHSGADAEARPSTADSMRILEATTPELKD